MVQPSGMSQPTPTGAVEKKTGFEGSLEALQGIVRKLESGELSLEDALKSFEEGVKLTRQCQEYLAGAERRIELLTQATSDGKVETQPFEPGRG